MVFEWVCLFFIPFEKAKSKKKKNQPTKNISSTSSSVGRYATLVYAKQKVYELLMISHKIHD